MSWAHEGEPAEHAAAVTKTLLLQLGVPFDDARIRDDLESAHDYPSLASIARALEGWGIEAEGLAVDAESLGSVPVPFIAHMQGARFRVVTRVDDDEVAFIDTESGPGHQTRAAFLSAWSGVALTARPGPGAGARARVDTTSRGRARRVCAWGLGLVLAALLVPDLSLALAGWLVVSVAGLACSGLLVAIELGDSRLGRKVCTGGKRIGCTVVLQSKGAKLGPVSMADLGLAYFAGVTLTLVLSRVVADDAPLLVALGIVAFAAVPYTLFSLAYQAFVLKAYCPLCVAVQVLAWLQAGLALAMWPGLDVLVRAPVAAAWAGACFGACAVAWAHLRPLLRRARMARSLEVELARLERNPGIIEVRLREHDEISLPPVPLEVVVGAAEPLLTITVYTELHCPYCAVAHGMLHALLEDLGDVLQVRYRLVAGADGAAEATLHELARRVAVGDQAAAGGTLHAWYEARQDQRIPATARPELEASARALLQRHVDASWPFPMVPAIFVGPRRLPDTLDVESLRYLLVHLRDERDDARDDA